MYALVGNGNTYFFRRKLRSNSFTPMPYGVGVNEVLCAAFFQESAFPFQKATVLSLSNLSISSIQAGMGALKTRCSEVLG